jgi:MinD superfamily P-loop ATPase
VNGHLNIGEIMSPPLIRQVKQYAEPSRNVIIDAPPGTSCPVIAAVKGSDFCILVTEPTPFGLHDLMLAVEVVERMQVPFGIVINRADIGNAQVEEFCAQRNIPIIMRIPYDENIAFLYSQGVPLVDQRSEYKEKFQGMISMIEDMLK